VFLMPAWTRSSILLPPMPNVCEYAMEK
jgi:hypothetical protein